MSKAFQNSQMPNIIQSFTGFKNRVINGDFSVWQRGTTGSNTTNGRYTADRFAVYSDATDITFDWSRVTGDTEILDAGFVNGLKVKQTGGTGILSLEQFIENITQFKVGEPITISFWAKTDDTPYTAYIAIQGRKGGYEDDMTEEITGSVNITNNLQRFSTTLNVPDWKTLGIDYNNLENTNLAIKIEIPNMAGNLIVTGVQVEKGSKVTEFEHIPFDIQLYRCRRYFFNTMYPHFRYDWLDGAMTTNAITTVDFTERNYYLKNKMRSAPSITVYAFETGTIGKYRDRTDGTDAGNPAIGPESHTGEKIYFYDDKGGLINEHLYSWHFTADAEL